MGVRRRMARGKRPPSRMKVAALGAQVRALPFAERRAALRGMPADLDLWREALGFTEAEFAVALRRLLGERS